MAEPPALQRTGAFASLVAALPAGGGDLLIADRPGLGIATVMANAGGGAGSRLEAAFGVVLPAGPAAAFGDGITVVGTGPDVWLAVREAAPDGWIDQLTDALAGAASVADQSSGYALLRIGGPGARALLSRGAFIDFDPQAFRAGSAAVTLIAHMGTVIWQRDDAPTYELAVFRSYADSFWHWINSAAAGYGARLARAS